MIMAPGVFAGIRRGDGFDLLCGTRTAMPAEGRIMREIESRTSESSNHILFPMAVGVLFLAMLVAGALLG